MIEKHHRKMIELLTCSVMLIFLSACTHFTPDKDRSSAEVIPTITTQGTKLSSHNADGWYEIGTGAPALTDSVEVISLSDALLAKNLEDLEAATSHYRESDRLVNVDTIGSSNYTSFLEKTTVVESTVVVFSNDSMILYPHGKERIAHLAAKAQPDDFFRVVGWSHGSTRIENGNEVLAENRARRVAQELYYLGVPVVQVLPEGCWSPKKGDDSHPSRGVVLSLVRRADDSLTQLDR